MEIEDVGVGTDWDIGVAVGVCLDAVGWERVGKELL